jgi:glucose-6-phosphate 1-dehydrogenase
MTNNHSDALVFFGATGDLAYKKIFPALHAMAKRGHLNEPVIGVAKAGWNLDQFKALSRGEQGGARLQAKKGMYHCVCTLQPNMRRTLVVQ